ncbi:hypothetical protein [Caulobacter endophyticus]|uniref:hypothetical protein n=1 Tax=Caulobacter endophyticus TaxID=2172652 RepID=UPI00240FB984|nr:hypothetical protein [Caulobacter endophyticus]MDG2528071.1 hypothetical protein [Caulobacter endophyticus]
MATILDVLPYDGGWCVKIAETGEVLFFTARRRAVAKAQRLARVWPRSARVKVHARRAPSPERGRAPEDFVYPLGAPA